MLREAHARGLTGDQYLWLGVDAWMANPIFDDAEDPEDRAVLMQAASGSLGLLPDIKGPLLQPYIEEVKWGPAPKC